MMAGRIGIGKRVHWIVKYAVPSRWGVARCGWAGEATLMADGVVSCLECVRRNGTSPEGVHEGRAEREDGG